MARIVRSLRRGERQNMCVKRGAQNPSPVDGETSTKVTANVWKYEVDWSRVRWNRMGLTVFAGTPAVGTRALRVKQSRDTVKDGYATATHGTRRQTSILTR